MNDSYKRLRAALAAGPTQGRWKMYKSSLRVGYSIVRELQDENGEAIIAWPGFDACNKSKREQDVNLRYFSAAQPDTISRLLYERDVLEKLCAIQSEELKLKKFHKK